MKSRSIWSVAFGLLFFTHAVWAQTLGTTNLVEGPTAGSDSVVLAASGAWTATTNVTWLHLDIANQSGTGSTNVVFTFDANSGTTRTGTLTIAGQTLNVTQAGSTYVVTTNVITLVSSGLNTPYGVAVDGMGNVFIADSGSNAIKEWLASSNILTTLVSSGLSAPGGVAVDGVGNVYIADTGHGAVKEWIVASNTITTLVSGLFVPRGVAVDAAGNVYIADYGLNMIKEWIAVSNTVKTLVGGGLSSPFSLAMDSAGNVYIADMGNNAIKEWIASSNIVTTLLSSGLSAPAGVGVDSGGNIYISDTSHLLIKELNAASNAVTTLVSSGLKQPTGVAVDGFGNVYIANSGSNSIIELPHAFVDSTSKVETALAGVDSLPVVLPTSANLTGPFAPVSDSAWLTITGVTNGVVSFAYATNYSANVMASRTAHITLLGQSIAVTQVSPPYFALGTTNLVEGPAAGSDSVVLAANGAWTAMTNATWLHLDTANQSGTGSTNVAFTFDANTGTTRTGTLTIAGQTLTVTQAGSTYAADVALTNATLLAALPLSSSLGFGVAADGMGNVYIADTSNGAIREWVAASNSVTTLVSTGLSQPSGVAVDGFGNVYIADTGHNAIKEWSAASNVVTTLISTGLNGPKGVAVDSFGNVYIADSANNAIKQWVPAYNTISTLVSSGLNQPRSVAVDAAGNVYIADTSNNAVKEWLVASNKVKTLVSSGLNTPKGVAVDGSGNVFMTDGNSTIKEWNAVTNTVSTLLSTGSSSPTGVAANALGNVFSIFGNFAIIELSKIFVDTTPKVEPAAAGSDTLPVVLPASANLTGPFAPMSDSPWLTISGVTNGVVTFAFTANNSASRTAHIFFPGRSITVTQLAPLNYFALGATNLVEGPVAGNDAVVLAAGSAWTATANDSWLHLDTAYQSGTDSTNVVFTFDTNTGATRTGSLTIAGQTLNVIQAVSTYVAAKPVKLVSGLFQPNSVAVDGAGNVYIANAGNGTISEWIATSNVVTTLVSGLSGFPFGPYGVALDSTGNVYIADTGGNTIKEWIAASNAVITFASWSGPTGLAVDSYGNVYFAGLNGTGKWTAATRSVSTLVSGASQAVAVDGARNVYIAYLNNSLISEWSAANGTVTTLATSASSGGYISNPAGVAVDGFGNVYAANYGNGFITEWIAASNTVAVLTAFGPGSVTGVTLDSAGNLYIAGYGLGKVYELLSHTFLDNTAKVEPALAGSDSLPVVLPATVNLTGPFAPASDSPWLTITGVTNGVVSFAFATNYSTNRTAHISLLGQSIAVTQPAVVPPLLTGFTLLDSGAFQFGFTNYQGVAFTVWTTTNLALPFSNWMVLGTLTNDGSGQFLFTDPNATNYVQQFYRVTSP